MNQTNLHHRHDKAFRQVYSDPRVFCALIKKQLPAKLTEFIKFGTLERSNATFIDKKGKQLQSDALYKVKTNNGGSIYLLVEHQSSYDKNMILRFINYIHGTINQHKEQGHSQLPFVIPILLYNGLQNPYPGSTKFSDAFNYSQHVKGFLIANFFMLDLTATKDEELLRDIWTACPNMLLKHLRVDDFLPILKKLQPVLLALKSSEGEKLAETMLEYIIRFTSIPDEDALLKTILEISTEVETHMQTVKERWEERAWLKGQAKGITQGKTDTLITVASKMIASGLDIQFISQTTELPIEKIQELSPEKIN